MATVQRLSVNILQLGDRLLTTDPDGLYLDGDPITTLFDTSHNGTVTSVGISTNASWLTVGSSPVTSSGTISINKTTGLAANQVLATPDGGTGTVSLRSLVLADLPSITYAKIQNISATNRLLGRSSSGTGVIEEIIVGTGLTLSSGTLTAQGTGSVTTVSVITANGISGSVANASTTPAITLTLGAITPTSVAASGTVTGSNLSGTNTGNQTITLTGDVTGSGTGSFVTTIGAGKVTNAMLAGSITASNLVGTDITTIGTLIAGTVPVARITGLAASATTDTTNAANISSGRLPNARNTLGAILYDTTPLQSADFSIRLLMASDESESITWDNRQLRSNTDVVSLDWAARQLITNDGLTVIVDWSNPTQLSIFSGSILFKDDGTATGSALGLAVFDQNLNTSDDVTFLSVVAGSGQFTNLAGNTTGFTSFIEVADGGALSFVTPTQFKADLGLGTAAETDASDVAYDATTWNGNLDTPTKNAVRDKFETLRIGTDIQAFNSNLTTITTSTLGDIIYSSATNTLSKLAGNTTTTKKFLRQTGNGSISAAPAWDTIVSGDIPTLNQDTTGSAAKWTTARLLAGNSVDGSANVAFANKFIAQGTADSGLSAAQFLGALGTGLVKNTTTTGVLSIATAGVDYSSAVIRDSQFNILATAPAINTVAYATDLRQMMMFDGTNWWSTSAYYTKELQAPDLGYTQTSNRAGYGLDYITDKVISNCAIGSNNIPIIGGIRWNSLVPAPQIFYNNTWNNFVVAVALRELGGILQHLPSSGSFWLDAFSGNSSGDIGINGLPIVQGYKVSLGAFPTQQIISGGSF